MLLVNIVRHIVNKNKPYDATDKKLGLWLLIVTHVNVLIGLYQYFAGYFGFRIFREPGFMKQPALRFWAVEHIGGMLIAAVLITIARGVFRKPITEPAKHQKAFILYLIALILILVSIPWPGRVVGRPLFPGM